MDKLLRDLAVRKELSLTTVEGAKREKLSKEKPNKLANIHFLGKWNVTKTVKTVYLKLAIFREGAVAD